MMVVIFDCTDGYLSINKANYDSNALDKYINSIDLEKQLQI